MRYRKAFLSLGVMAAAALLAMPALAAEPPLTCTTGNNWAVNTVGLVYDAAANKTSITYNIGSEGNTPDHVGTFVHVEAGTPTTDGSANVSLLCTGDSVLGIGSSALCHEYLVRFNNQQQKATKFTLSVAGRRLPLTTSAIVKKGNSQGSCAIVGFGPEDTSAGSCVHQCGDFNENQSVRTVETFNFKGCEITFEFNPTTGELFNFDAQPIAGSTATCTKKMGLINELLINGGLIDPDNEILTFGDGWISSGDNSCTTRLIAGRYCTVCN